MIVTIDGPAGAGKSSVARALARRIGFEFLDTGAMYRAVTWAALRDRLDLEQAADLARLAERIDLRWIGGRLLIDGTDATDAIRTPEITALIRHAADPPEVRRVLVRRQQEWVGDRNVVTEGRDQGTVAFPQAGCKIFLTASPEERARRRAEQLRAQGHAADEREILAAQNERDRRDASRPEGPLRAADDSIELMTDGLSPDDVIERLVAIVRRRFGDVIPD